MVSAWAKISSARARKSRTRARSFRFVILRGPPIATLWEAYYHTLGASRLIGVIFLAGLRLNLGLGRRGARSRVRAGDRRNRQAPCRRWQDQVARHARLDRAPHRRRACISVPHLGTYRGEEAGHVPPPNAASMVSVP